MVTPPMNYLVLFYMEKHSKNTLFDPIRIWLSFSCDIQKYFFKTKQNICYKHLLTKTKKNERVFAFMSHQNQNKKKQRFFGFMSH